MVGVQLRGYQQEAVDAVFAKFDSGEDATLLVAATGTGKTVVLGEVARRFVEQGKAVMVMAHRSELIDQAASRLSAMCGVQAEIEMADRHVAYTSPLCIASVQTLQGARLDALRTDYYDLLIIDEAHHAVADSYLRVIAHLGCKVLGVTATADRADRVGLANVFDSIAYEYPMARAVADGYLSPITAKCIPLRIDLSQVKVSHGDFQQGDLGHAIEPYFEEIANVMAVECAGRKTVAFLPLVSTAEAFAEVLGEHGMRSVCVSGYDAKDERNAKVRDFVEGRYDVLSNALLFIEGWDCPEVDCIVMLRPTKSRGLYTQAVGRGTRIAPGKENLLLLDFLWMTEKHDLCRPASLLGKEREIQAKMQQIAEDGGAWDLEDLAEQAEKDVVEERESALAAELERLKHRKKKLVDPLQFAMSIQDLDLADYKPTFAYELKKPSDKQLEVLEKFGIDSEAVDNAGQASLLISSCISRRENGLATPKQIRCLERYGFIHVGSWTFDSATKMIGRISSNQWRIPYGVNPKTYSPREATNENRQYDW